MRNISHSARSPFQVSARNPRQSRSRYRQPSVVMPGLDPGIHSVTFPISCNETEWIAGSSPAMTTNIGATPVTRPQRLQMLAVDLLEQRAHVFEREGAVDDELLALDVPDQRRAADVAVGVELDRAGRAGIADRLAFLDQRDRLLELVRPGADRRSPAGSWILRIESRIAVPVSSGAMFMASPRIMTASY